MLAFLVSVALGGDSYVPPMPPPRVITYTEMRFETRYTYTPIVVGTSYSAPASASSTGSVRSSAPPPETEDQKCAKGDADACHQVASNFHWNGDSGRAAELFGKLCDQGRAKSCAAAGFVVKKPADVDRYLQRACDGGYVDACGDLGFRLLDGVDGMPVDETRAARLFERSCASGSADGCVGLGWLHLLGKGGYAFDPKAAVPFGQKACPDPQRGKAEPCLERARFHEWAGDRAAASLVRLDICYQPKIPGAKMAEACRLVAPVLYHGEDGMKADSLGAFAAYERACGYDGESCLWAARLAKVHAGYREPLVLAERSCARGYGKGCTTYADWLSAEPGSYADRTTHTKVSEARRKGCDLGDPVACARIGLDNNSLDDLEKGCVGGVIEACTRADRASDRARVAAMFGRACEGGVGAACVSAGEMSAKGEGVPASAEQAMAWFQAACTDGDRAGCVRVADSLLDRGRPGDAATADRVYTANCDAGFGPACIGLVDAIAAGRLPAGSRDSATLQRRACLGGAREACDSVSRGVGPIIEAGTLVDWYADETFTRPRGCAAAGPLLWHSGARWTGTLLCGGVPTPVEGALLQPAMDWRPRTAVRVLKADDVKTSAPWKHVGMACRTGDTSGHVYCVDGEEYLLRGPVYEPIAPELAQLPPRRSIRAGKKFRISTSVPEVERVFLADCVAEEELRWTPEGWYEGRVRCENPHAVVEKVGLGWR